MLYNGPLPSNVEEIPVCYQEDNNSAQVWHRQFDFKIYVTKPGITTVGTMTSGFRFKFTCPLLNELAQNCNIPLPEAKAYINDMANMGYIEI